MGRRPLSSYTEEELEKMQTVKLIDNVDGFFGTNMWSTDDVEDIEKFILKTEGTPVFFYLLAKLVRSSQDLTQENNALKDRVKELEEALGSLGNFRKKNEYGY